MYIVSACLAGINCRYDGGNSENKRVAELVREGKAVPICPEVLGGLSTPREKCELCYNGGKRKVISEKGKDCTNEYLIGAEKVLQIAKSVDAKTAILKSKSPSCGLDQIYDGTFKKKLIEGNGLTAELLLNNGINVITENDIDKI